MKNKRIIAIVLSTSILLTSIGTVFAVNNGELKISETISKLFNENNRELAVETNSMGKEKPKEIKLEPPKTLQSISQNPDKDKAIYKGTKVSTESGDPFKKDIYHLGKADIDQLINEGHTMQDIFKADELGNSISEEPKKILERKKKENKDLNTIVQEIKAEKRLEKINRLKEKYPDEYKKLSQENLNEEQQLELLDFIDENDVFSVEQMVKDYRNNGRNSLAKWGKAKKISKEKLAQLGLTEEEVGGFSEEAIQILAEESRRSNLPLKKMLKGLVVEKEKHGRSGK